MSFQTTTSPLDKSANNTNQKMAKSVTEMASSPPMFDDDIISIENPSQHNRSVFTFNQENPCRESQQPSPQSAYNFEMPSIPGLGCSMPSESLQTDATFLSMSHMERVTTCRLCDLCDCTTRLSESADNHNRSITDAAETTTNLEDSFIGRMFLVSPKRKRLDEPSEMVPDISMDLHTSDILERLADSTKAVNEHLVTLHKDSANHLMMVNNIIGAMDM